MISPARAIQIIGDVCNVYLPYRQVSISDMGHDYVGVSFQTQNMIWYLKDSKLTENLLRCEAHWFCARILRSM